MPIQYSVIVGNIGTVYHGTDGLKARTLFEDYVGLSMDNIGRGGNEPVFLLQDGEPVREHQPPQETD